MSWTFLWVGLRCFRRLTFQKNKKYLFRASGLLFGRRRPAAREAKMSQALFSDGKNTPRATGACKKGAPATGLRGLLSRRGSSFGARVRRGRLSGEVMPLGGGRPRSPPHGSAFSADRFRSAHLPRRPEAGRGRRGLPSRRAYRSSPGTRPSGSPARDPSRSIRTSW